MAICSNIPLVRDKLLGAPAFVRIAYCWVAWLNCDVNRQQIVTSSAERKQSKRDTESMCEDRLFIFMYHSMGLLCHVRNVCAVMTNCLCTHECYFGVYFPSCFWEIKTKITLSWVHKQFVTEVYTLSSMSTSQVHIRIASPPLRHPCYMGINIPTKDELIANRMPIDELAKHLGECIKTEIHYGITEAQLLMICRGQ